MPYVRIKLHPRSCFPNLMKQLGLVPEDTKFNRRAAAYAKEARQEFYYQNRKARVSKSKTEEDTTND